MPGTAHHVQGLARRRVKERCTRCRSLHRSAGLQQDGAAVKAALTTPWSSGQTEGQVGKLKLLKRQTFGRAKFDLLRRRVLLAV
jgi:transposase